LQGAVFFDEGRDSLALYVVIGMVALGGVIFSYIVSGDTAIKAKELAKEQLGTGFEYHISNLRISGDRGSAVVIAYNSNEIKNIVVNW